MRKRSLAVLPLLLSAATHAAAQPTVYVSNLTGQEVLAVAPNGSTSVVLSGAAFNSATFTPEDMVVGPDGKLYICDAGASPAIWPFDPAAPVAAGVNPLKIIDFTASTFPAGIVPVGPTFSGSDDLYVNTRGAGVWSVPGVAAAGSAPPYTAVQVFAASVAGGGAGGTAVEAFGHLLIADHAGNRVVSAAAQVGPFPNFTAAPAPLLSVTAPIGITTNTCGDVLVASGTAIQRFSPTKDPSTGVLSAQLQNNYIDFGGTNLVEYLERDAGNNLYVATNSKSAGGILWKVAPGPADPISSCAAGVAQQIVSLKKLSQGSSAILRSSQTQAIGVAIPPTNYTATATFSPSTPSATFHFGHYDLTLTYKQVLTTFTQTFTAIMSRPIDVTFGTAFPGGTVGTRFPSLGGFVIQFLTPSQGSCTSYGACGVPVANVDYVSAPIVTTAFEVIPIFHDPIQGVRAPGVAHSSTDTLTGVYTDNVTTDFWVLGDPGSGGSFGNWTSKFVVFDEPFQAGNVTLPLSVRLNEPALGGNPLFNLGQNFTVSITVTDARGVAVPGLTLRISAARMSPLPIVLQVVQATNNSTTGNLLKDNGNEKYSIGIDTSLFTGGPGTYQFTISGNGFPPVLPATPLPFYATFQK
jgi:hypothetical protein